MSYAHERGALLDVRGERWLLTRAIACADCTILSLEGRGPTNHRQRLRLIEPFERARQAGHPRARRVTRQTAMRMAIDAIDTQRPANGLWTAAAAQIELWPYQLEPALAALAGATRLLLADVVGLGKTIQAGLLLAELFERGWIERALIVCPAGLRDTWATELRRFGISAAVFDQAAIAERIATLPPDVNPWLGERVVISSIDFIKRIEVRSALDAVPIDLLIADEAHHLAPGTDRGAAVAAMAARSPWCVLLTATPHSGDATAFEYLRAIGSTGDPLTIFKRTRADVGIASRRREHVLRVSPTIDEQRLLSGIDDYTRRIWAARGNDAAVRLVAITLARRAASSASALSRTVRRRLDLLSNRVPEALQPALPWADDDPGDEVEDDRVLSVAAFDDVGAECACLQQLLDLADACDESSKLTRIVRIVKRISEPAIVFTEYRDTLESIVAGAGTHFRTGAIHGGLPVDLRRRVVDRFNAGDLDLLVATDTAGEGLNLQTRCRLVIDVEIPWSPVRLEQRIGRVDRIGQSRTVHAIRFCHAGSIEERVLTHLRHRHDVARAIFDHEMTHFADHVPVESSIADAGLDEAARLQRQRRGRALSPSSVVWAPARRGGCYVCVVRETSENRAGATIEDRVSAYRLEFAQPPISGREWRAALVQIRDAVKQSIDVKQSAEPAVARRIGAIRSELARRESLVYQASLFDSRAELAAAARRQRDAVLAAALDRVRQLTSRAEDQVRVEVVAVWPER